MGLEFPQKKYTIDSVKKGLGYTIAKLTKVKVKKPVTSGEKEISANIKHYYYFYDDGTYAYKEENSEDRLVVLPYKSQQGDESKFYMFNDPNDASNRLDYVLNIYYPNGKSKYEQSTKLVYNIYQSQIDEWMEKSDVTNLIYLIPGINYIKEILESNWGKLDFYNKYIVPMMMESSINEYYRGMHEDYIRGDKGGFCIFEGEEKKTYNAFDAGNYLWGYAARLMGVRLDFALIGAHINTTYQRVVKKDTSVGYIDDPYDQIAIFDGYFR